MRRQCKSIGCVGTAQAGQDFCPYCSVDIKPSTSTEMDLHRPGAKADADKPKMRLVTGDMARAITEVAKVGTYGANKYMEGGWIHVLDGFNRYEDAQQRHAAYRHMGEVRDEESGLLHLAHEAWNALAKLELYLRETGTTTQH